MPLSLSSLLDQKSVLLADGATGTNYFAMGLESGDAPELWNETAPEKVASLHQQFVEAGADIILTNTFGCNRSRLALHDAQNRTIALNEKGAQIARSVSDAAGRDVLVAGCVGPTGELFDPLGAMTHDEAVDIFSQQIEGLKQGGADVIWIETMSSKEEIIAAAQAAIESGMEYVFTASFDTAGRTMMGLPPASLNEIAHQCSRSPLAVGANCGVGATDLLNSILDMSGAKLKGSEIAYIAKANCGVPQVSGDQVIYTGTPELMGAYAKLAIDAGARIIGGCCGTEPQHLKVMRQAIDGHVQKDRPDLETIIAHTGPFVNPVPQTPASATDNKAKGRKRSNRRA